MRKRGVVVLFGQLEPCATEEFRGSGALSKLLKDFEFASVLDISGGAGKHAEEFLNRGKVTVIVLIMGNLSIFCKKQKR